MKLIEVIGPNGAGKSTLHDTLLRQHERLTGKKEALTLAALYWSGQQSSWQRRTALGLMLRLARRSSLFAKISRTVAIDQTAQLVGPARLAHHELYATVMNLICANEKAAHTRLKAVNWFLNTLDEVLLLAATPLDTVVILDESICHMIYGLSSISAFDEQLVEAYFEQVPMPAAIIHVRVAAEDHLDNVRRRAAAGHVMPGHIDIINDVRALADDLHNRAEIDRIAVSTLRQRGICYITHTSRSEDTRTVIEQLDELQISVKSVADQSASRP
jgi:hypothetical protein